MQFQVPISSFQLIQEKIVRARVGEAVSSAMNNLAAVMLQDQPLLTHGYRDFSLQAVRNNARVGRGL